MSDHCHQVFFDEFGRFGKAQGLIFAAGVAASPRDGRELTMRWEVAGTQWQQGPSFHS